MSDWWMETVCQCHTRGEIVWQLTGLVCAVFLVGLRLGDRK
jgi:hypothetical protein